MEPTIQTVSPQSPPSLHAILGARTTVSINTTRRANPSCSPTHFFWKVTPSSSNLAQAFSTSGTEMAMWPNPRGSELPLW